MGDLHLSCDPAVVLSVVFSIRRPSLRPALQSRTASRILAQAVLGFAATTLYAFATLHGQLAIVSVLGSLYPAVTLLLAYRLLGSAWVASSSSGSWPCSPGSCCCPYRRAGASAWRLSAIAGIIGSFAVASRHRLRRAVALAHVERRVNDLGLMPCLVGGDDRDAIPALTQMFEWLALELEGVLALSSFQAQGA